MNLKDFIRSIPDYPKKGILFRDITTLIKDDKAFSESIFSRGISRNLSQSLPYSSSGGSILMETIAIIPARGGSNECPSTWCAVCRPGRRGSVM